MYLYNQLQAPKIYPIYKIPIKSAIKRSFCISKNILKLIKNSLSSVQMAFPCAGKRPNENSFGASGSQAMPDFSARPAGLDRFQYPVSILYCSEIALKADFGILHGIPM
jgi:hypothetical protein